MLGRPQHALRRERRASAARPYRERPVRECMGDLWSPIGVQSTPSGENGGRAQLAPTGSVRFGDVGATCGRPRACKARPQEKTAGERSSPLQGASGSGMYGRPVVAHRRAEHALRGERRASTARPYRERPVRRCRGDLWSPVGVQSTPLGENGGRAQLAPTGGVRFGNVGATCGRPWACKARPSRRERRVSAARPYRWRPVRGCRGDLWSPVGVQSTPFQERTAGEHSSPLQVASGSKM